MQASVQAAQQQRPAQAQARQQAQPEAAGELLQETRRRFQLWNVLQPVLRR